MPGDLQGGRNRLGVSRRERRKRRRAAALAIKCGSPRSSEKMILPKPASYDPIALVRRGHFPFADSAKGRQDLLSGACKSASCQSFQSQRKREDSSLSASRASRKKER